MPIEDTLAAAYQEHAARYRLKTYGSDPARSPWVFHHVADRRRARAGTRIRALHRAVTGAAARAGIAPEWHLHDLRHRRVTTWLEQGQQLEDVRLAMGHSDVRVTMGYAKLLAGHVGRILERGWAQKGLRAPQRWRAG